MLIRFLLNNREIAGDLHPGTLLLDFIRQNQRLVGTKIGCREGDCGACTVLVGKFENGRLCYRSMTSCLMPIGNAAGKHIVTIEGLNLEDLSPVQRAVVEEGGTQCGFCTVGFIVSLAGFCLDERKPSRENVIAAMDGNICRCTGYKSLERAGERIVGALLERDPEKPLAWLVENGFLPAWFTGIEARLQKISEQIVSERVLVSRTAKIVGGGTDLFVQQPENMGRANINLFFDRTDLEGIEDLGEEIRIGASATASHMRESEVMNRLFPDMRAFMKLVSSTPIRNMGTLAGNLANASPIGDLTIFFLALGADLHLRKGDRVRRLALQDFYKAYKTLDLEDGECIEAVSFPNCSKHTRFNFEKVCKRTHLDIASVNAAARLEMEDGRIREARLSVGGVGPVPMFLKEASAYLTDRQIDSETVTRAAEIAMKEISPISDARGSADYKRLLSRQLIYAHFLELFPRLELEALV